MTTIYAMPQITQMQVSIPNNADWLDALQFFPPTGTIPLDLTGISFHATLRPQVNTSQINPVATLDMSTANGLLINFGSSGILQWNIPAATMYGIEAGTYIMDVLARAEIEINLMDSSPAIVTISQGVTQP